MKTKCPVCNGKGLDYSHQWPDGTFASCERCEGYGTIEDEGTGNPYEFTAKEKRAAQIIDQLCPVFIADTKVYIGPETFKRLTLRLAELL